MENAEVLDHVRAVLRSSPYHALRRIECHIDENGALVLKGTLGSYHHKQLAFHAINGKVNGTPIRLDLLKVEG